MQPYEIVTRRITVYAGQLAEIPPDAPAGLRTWTCHAFFVPGAAEKELKARVTRAAHRYHEGRWRMLGVGARWKPDPGGVGRDAQA